jgi:hypothetical protein
MVGARAREWYDKQAKERQHEGQKSGGRGHKKNSVESLPPSSDSGKARDQVGKVVGVSGKTIDYASKVLNQAVAKREDRASAHRPEARTGRAGGRPAHFFRGAAAAFSRAWASRTAFIIGRWSQYGSPTWSINAGSDRCRTPLRSRPNL